MGDEKRVECFLFYQFFENVLRHFEIRQLRENFHAKIFRSLPPFFARDFEPIRARRHGRVRSTVRVTFPSASRCSIRRGELPLVPGRGEARPSRTSATRQIISSTRSAIFPKSA